MDGKRKKASSTSDSNTMMLYQSSFSNMPYLMYIIDKNCSVESCNKHLLTRLNVVDVDRKTVGWLYKQMKQSGFWTEEQAQMFKTKDIEVLLSGQPLLDQPELPVVDQHKSIHHYKSSRIPLHNKAQEVIGLLVIFTEITERLQLEEQLNKIKAQLQSANANADHNLATDVAQAARTNPLRVLVIEDNLIAQKATQAVLMQVDCLVDIADSEAQLWDVFEPGKYDVVFMDIGLEGTSGYILAQEIRKKEEKQKTHVPIIALTGFKAEAVSFDCDYYQMEGAITKPLTVEQANQVIQHYVYNIDIDVKGLKHVES